MDVMATRYHGSYVMNNTAYGRWLIDDNQHNIQTCMIFDMTLSGNIDAWIVLSILQM